MQLVSRDNIEPMRRHQQVKAENIKLLAESGKAPGLALAVSEAPGKPAEKAGAKPEVCLEWGVFSGDGLTRAVQALEKLQLGDKLIQHKVDKPEGYWVYVMPRKTLQDAQKKVDELKRLGVQESFIIRENSKWQYAISLGMFTTAEAAAKFLDQLREKGVKSAVSGPRSHEAGSVVFQVKDVSDSTAAQLARMKLDFPGSELRPRSAENRMGTDADQVSKGNNSNCVIHRHHSNIIWKDGQRNSAAASLGKL